ncbi:MAG: aminotransferase class III-fold pyridoxal phosphate-dependent enzyme, partial [Chloroflexota bacterium]
GVVELRQRHPAVVSDVRGRGLMVAIELARPGETARPAESDDPSEAVRTGAGGHWLAERLVAEAFEHGLLVLPAGARSVRLSPPLTVSAGEVEVALEILEEALAAVERAALATPPDGPREEERADGH